jgi:hypothetical protein
VIAIFNTVEEMEDGERFFLGIEWRIRCTAGF